MEKKGINLIPGEQKMFVGALILRKKLNLVATASIAVFTMAAIVVLVLLLSFNLQIKKIEGKIKSAEEEIGSYQPVEINLTILNNRLQITSKILSARQGLTDVLAGLKKAIPQDVEIDIAQSGAKGGVKITAKSRSLPAINQFYKTVSSTEFLKTMKTIMFSSISRSENGEYTFVFECAKT